MRGSHDHPFLRQPWREQIRKAFSGMVKRKRERFCVKQFGGYGLKRRKPDDETTDLQSLPSGWVCLYETESMRRYVLPSGLTCDGHSADRNCIVHRDGSCPLSCLIVTLNLDLSGSSSSSVSPWDYPRDALNYGSTFHLCGGVQVDDTTPCAHSTRSEQWDTEGGEQAAWRSLRSCRCPLLFESSDDSRSLLCTACQVLRHTVRSLALRQKTRAEAGVPKDEGKVPGALCCLNPAMIPARSCARLVKSFDTLFEVWRHVERHVQRLAFRRTKGRSTTGTALKSVPN